MEFVFEPPGPTKLFFDTQISSFKSEDSNPFKALPLSQVAEEVTDFVGDVPELNALKENLFKSLIDPDQYDVGVGAYRALQIMHVLGADNIIKQMFGSNTEHLTKVRVPSALSLKSLAEKDSFYGNLYDAAQRLLRKSSYYNSDQTPLHKNITVPGCGCTNLLKLLTLVFLYMDTN
jgi:hypothetical protein